MFSASTYIPSTTQHETATILLIEDNELNLSYTEKQLTSAKYRVRIALTPEAGWQIIQSGGIQLIVSDLIFGGGSAEALAFLQRVRATPAIAQIPVIISTGERRREIIQKVMAAGANYFLSKPYPSQNLIDRVKQCLEGK
jgi:CheY-like chemotaxis protein